MTNWLDVPSDIWKLIFGLLDLLDTLRFKAVCPLFRSIAADQKRSYRLSRALLLLPGDRDSQTHTFFSLADKSTYEVHLPELQGRRCLGSSYGWLITADFLCGDISLINPITREKISLPPLSSFTDPPGVSLIDRLRDSSYLLKATLSAEPSKGKNYIVMAIFTGRRALSFCRPGDRKWTTLTKQGDHIEDVICHMGKFYAIDNTGKFLSWDHCDVKASVTTIISRQREENTTFQRYLVDSPSGELLKICRKRICRNDSDLDNYYKRAEFSVFKLDKERNRWKSLKRLGDQALFWGYDCAICISTLGCPEFLANCIYFTLNNYEVGLVQTNTTPMGTMSHTFGSYGMAVYNLEDGTIQRLYQNSSSWVAPCIWVTPTANKSNDTVTRPKSRIHQSYKKVWMVKGERRG